jgi:hypothetical protein
MLRRGVARLTGIDTQQLDINLKRRVRQQTQELILCFELAASG